MNYIIVGGDARMAHLAEHLRQMGRGAQRALAGGEDAATVMAALEILRGADAIVTNCPPRARGAKLSMDDILRFADPKARVYLCGPAEAGVEDDRVVDLWRDEALLRENARLTAEGALCAAMQASRRGLRDVNCLVIGWGRVGSALAKLLAAMGARVTVVSRSGAHRDCAAGHGATAVPPEALPRVLPGSNLIFSTPPAMVLDAERLRHVDPDALIIDLASPPYGVDLRAAWQRGIRAWREPGLPGRHCPDSAGLALARAIIRHEGEDRHE